MRSGGRVSAEKGGASALGGAGHAWVCGQRCVALEAGDNRVRAVCSLEDI